MTEIEKKVWEILGRHNCITAYGIKTESSRDDVWIHDPREIRHTVNSLIENHGKLIGSGNHGYFIIKGDKDMQEATSKLEAQAFALLKRVANLKKIRVREVYDQVEMELGDD